MSTSVSAEVRLLIRDLRRALFHIPKSPLDRRVWLGALKWYAAMSIGLGIIFVGIAEMIGTSIGGR